MMHNDAWAATPTARRILLIEDEPGIRIFASRALRTAGFAVAEAASGCEGLRIALSQPPNIVLLDLSLPDLAGEEVLRRLRQERPDQAVLVWSASSDPDAEHRCLLLGARAWLRKPVPIAELLRSIGAPGRPAAHTQASGAGLIQRQGHRMTSAGGSRPDSRNRQGAAPAVSGIDSRRLPDPGAPHPCAALVRGPSAARRFPPPPSPQVSMLDRGLNAWHRAGGGVS